MLPKNSCRSAVSGIPCLSAAGASWDGTRAELLFFKHFPSAVDFFASFFHQGKKEGPSGNGNSGNNCGVKRIFPSSHHVLKP